MYEAKLGYIFGNDTYIDKMVCGVQFQMVTFKFKITRFCQITKVISIMPDVQVNKAWCGKIIVHNTDRQTLNLLILFVIDKLI